MKIYVHERLGSFSDRWIEYLELNNIPYNKINIHRENLNQIFHEADILLCHLSQEDPYYWLVGSKLGLLGEIMGVKIYPDLWTNWFFDDKIIQKFLLDGISNINVPTHIYFSFKDAIKKVSSCKYPFVFKLKGGAGAVNVKLVKNKFSAFILVFKMFFLGIPKISKYSLLLNRLSKANGFKNKFYQFLIGSVSALKSSEIDFMFGREKGYFYMQDFINGADHDIRIIVIGNKKLIALKRFNRKNDFRASGSGSFIGLDKDSLSKDILHTSLGISKKLKAQSLALDFVYDKYGKFHLIEISHGFAYQAYDVCSGYWNENLVWVDGNLNLSEEILINILSKE